MKKKEWWKSKTIWVNIIMLATVIITSHTGFEFTQAETGSFLIIVNLILRAVTGSGLQWRK